MSINPYAPPKALDDTQAPSTAAGTDAPPLWNPNAAANWSLLFSPAFGSYLHMLNWRALGETKRAAGARTWFVVSIIFLVLSTAVNFALHDGATLARAVGFAFLISWYYSAGRSQATYVNDRFGGKYPHKPWTVPLLVALGALIGFLAITTVIAVVVSPTL